MYEAHFGLHRRPFRDASAHVPLPSHEALARRLRYALEEAQGPVMVHGLPGVGKTRMARALAARMGLRSAHLTFPALPAGELLTLLAEELRAPPDPMTGVAGAVRRVQGALAAQTARGGRFLLIVDEAHLLDEAAHEGLRLLLNFETEGVPDLALVLLGGPELPLQVPESLADRMAARCLMRPLDEAESAAYVIGRMVAAGGSAETFEEGAIGTLFEASEGLPRRINRLADLGLLLAYADGKSRVSAAEVSSAARELAPPGWAA